MRRFVVGARALSTAKTVADLAAHLRLHPHPYVQYGQSNPYRLPSTASIREAAQHMVAHRLTFATAIEDGKYVGLLTERDVLRYITHAADSAFFTGSAADDMPIAKIMTPKEDATSVRLDDTLEHTLRLQSQRIWRHLPVLDYWGQFHSILHLRDVVMEAIGPSGSAFWQGKSASDVLALKRKRRIQASDGGASGTVGDPAMWQAQLSAYLIANTARHTMSENATVEDAACKLLGERLTFLTVVDTAEKRVVGIVNERAFLQHCAQGAATRGTDGVGAILTPLESLLSVTLTDSASRCIDLFFSHNVRHLPVIDPKGHLIGIISIRDMLLPLLPAKGDAAWSL